MRFVIVGGGRVGLRTARVLHEGGHEVVVVERDASVADRVTAAGIEVVTGDGSREAVLEEAGVASADAVAALTGDLNVNFAVCLVAKGHGCRTVLRIDEDYREEIYRRYADQVDEVVYPERLGAIGAKNALLGGDVQAIADVATDLQVLLVTVTDRSPARGYTTGELELPARARLLAVETGGDRMRVPMPDDTIEAGDRVVVLAEHDALAEVRRLLVGGEE